MKKEVLDEILQENFFIKFFFASFVLILGWFFAKIFSKLIGNFIETSRINLFLKKIGVQSALEKIHPQLSLAKFFGELSRWFFITIVLMIFAEILGLTQFSQFLGEKVVPIFFDILIASLIFIAAAFLSDLANRLLIGTFEKEKIVFSKFLGRGIAVVIWILASLAILYQLKIASNLILITFAGFVIFIALSGGIVVGFVLKDTLTKFLKNWEEKNR